MKDYDRAKLAADAKSLIASGKSKAAVARRLGISAATLRRILIDPNPGETKAANSGRKPKWELTEEEAFAFKETYWMKHSIRLTVEDLISADKLRPETAEMLLEILDLAAENKSAEQWPTWITRAVRMCDEEAAARKGPKALQYLEPMRSRGAFYEYWSPDGEMELKPLYPNALWESDDESINTPFKWLDPETGKELVGRQTLKTADVYSAKILGGTLVGRYGDAYNMLDQATHARMLIEQFGLPLAWRLERGRWENRFWDGMPLPTRWIHRREDGEYRWGGMCDLIHIIHAKASREKGLIEGTFNHEQNLNAHTTLDQGRKYGEHEAADKKLRNAKRGSAQSGLWHVPTVAVRADIEPEIWQRFNREPKVRGIFGGTRHVPDEIFVEPLAGLNGEAIQGFPDCKRPCPTDEWWRLYPAKTAATVRNSTVTVTWNKHRYTFEVVDRPFWDWISILPHGWPVFVAFDPMRPELGAHIANGRPATHPDNVGRVPLGHTLFTNAPAPMAAPQFRLGNVPNNAADFNGRKDWKKRVKGMRQSTRTTGVLGGSEDTRASEDTAADGLGNMVRMAQGNPSHEEEATRSPRRSAKPDKPEEIVKRRGLTPAELEEAEADIF